MATELEQCLAIVASHMEGSSHETRRVLFRIINQIASIAEERSHFSGLHATGATVDDSRRLDHPGDLASPLQQLREKLSDQRAEVRDVRDQ